jgi:predicted Na+-dependent transporter
MKITDILTVVMTISLMLRAGLELDRQVFAQTLSRYGLLARALLANFVLVPLFAFLLVSVFRVDAYGSTGILLMSMAPGVPFLINTAGQKQGGSFSFALAVSFIFTALSVVTIPITAQLLLPAGLGIARLPVEKVFTSLLAFQLVPLVLGSVFSSRLQPAVTRKLLKLLTLVFAIAATCLMVLIVPTIFAQFSSVSGFGRIAIIVAIAAFSLIVGYVLGGSVREYRRTLSVATTMRNVGLCALIGGESFGDTLVIPTILVYFAIASLLSWPVRKYYQRTTPQAASAVIVFLILICLPAVARAQSVPAREYLNTPVDEARFFLIYTTSATSTAAQSDIPLPNNESVSQSGSASILYSFPIAGKYGGIALTGGKATVGVMGPSGNLAASGFTDPTITMHMNFFGAPALRADQIRSATPQTFFGLHLSVNPPLGSYQAKAPLNVGTNRWTYSPLLNLSITHDKGISWVDVYVAGRFFTNNNAFQGNGQLSQSPLGTFTAHYSHNIGRVTYAAIGVYYDIGGQTFINGVPQNNSAHGLRPGASISTAIGSFRLTLRYDNTASTPDAAPSNGVITLRLGGPLF